MFLRLLGAASVIEEAGGVFRIDSSVFERGKSGAAPGSATSSLATEREVADYWNDDDLILLGPTDISPARRQGLTPDRTTQGAEGRGAGRSAEQDVRNADGDEDIIRSCAFGLDYDRYLEGFRPDDGGIMRSLVYFTRSANARSALLAVAKGREFAIEYQLGVDESCDGGMVIPAGSELAEQVMHAGCALYLDIPLSEIPGFEWRCSEDHLLNFKPVVFIPLGFRSAAGYLIMSMYPDSGGLEEIISRLRTNAHFPQDR